MGNHKYGTNGAGGYFAYFGDTTTPMQSGCTKNWDSWYSFNKAHAAVSASADNAARQSCC